MSSRPRAPVRYRPSRTSQPENWKKAAVAHANLCDTRYGDHVSLIDIYKEWEHHGQQKDWCMDNCLHVRSLRQAADIRGQLEKLRRDKDDEGTKFREVWAPGWQRPARLG